MLFLNGIAALLREKQQPTRRGQVQKVVICSRSGGSSKG
jgi:hypothetical protein